MNYTYIHLLQHRIAGNVALSCDTISVVAIVLPCFLLFCLLILCCNVGGTLDCIFAEHRRRQQRLKQKQAEREVTSAAASSNDQASAQPLLGSSAAGSISSPSSSPPEANRSLTRIALPGWVRPVLSRPGGRTVQLNPTRTWASTVAAAEGRSVSGPLLLTPNVGKYQLAGSHSKN